LLKRNGFARLASLSSALALTCAVACITNEAPNQCPTVTPPALGGARPIPPTSGGKTQSGGTGQAGLSEPGGTAEQGGAGNQAGDSATALGGSSGATTGEGGSVASGGAVDTGALIRTVSFADNNFYRAMNVGPLGSNSYVFAAVLRASPGLTMFPESLEIVRKGGPTRGWTFARVGGAPAVRFRHHDAPGIIRGTSVAINMDRMNLVVFSFDGTTQRAYENGRLTSSVPVDGITPAVDSDDFFVPSSSSAEDVLLAEFFWSNAPESFLDDVQVAAWSESAIDAMSRGEPAEGWLGCEGHLSAADAGDDTWTDRIAGLTFSLDGSVNVIDVPAQF